ncbi:acyl-CoA dehydrogenase family protein [Prescottella agglutinans]|uniref:Alkylation response protein AidB-like acyl-CoA dehydrogenase n=1 Tax=Prescottella agglutinans TaxID=1644129 RepID=A0ABT6M9E6_9NOCA|nr:acyl-CoA dehydrogenase family protein [Prescottella agglutinans]MDH6280937.1 alkylation response protein AidB-like acyl-CoA dehydrogenase [Prescottella agglutinans]
MTHYAADAEPAEMERIRATVRGFADACDFASMTMTDYLGRRFDAGLAWVDYPVGQGGLGLARSLQGRLESALREAGGPAVDVYRNPIGTGMGAPTVAVHGTAAQRQRLLRPLWTGEEIWCQLFSEPDAGSDLAGVFTRAVRDGDAWVINGQKVWTSYAHKARWAMLLARTDPTVRKHQGLTYFVLDMTSPGVEVRPLRQANGQAEFNEVFLTDVRIPDAMRLGDEGQGWEVARTTLMNERTSIGGREAQRDEGYIGRLLAAWRERPELRTPAGYYHLMQVWADVEASRLTNERTRQALRTGAPGLEGSGAKVTFAKNNQAVTRLWAQLDPQGGLTYDNWSVDTGTAPSHRPGMYHYLRSRANSIEGGTSEILLGLIADRVLGLPKEPNPTATLAWQDIPK